MFADVILPLPLSELYTYSVPPEMRDKITKGARVIVPFGKSRHYTALVIKLHDNKPLKFQTKDIHSLIDSQPVVNDSQISLWEWISFYYMSSLGDVFHAALPASMKSNNKKVNFKPKTETVYTLTPLSTTNTNYEIFGRAKKQQFLYLQISDFIKEYGAKHISGGELKNLAYYSSSVKQALIKKDLLKPLIIETGRIDNESETTRKPYPLSDAQQKALKEINRSFETKATCLLHGVTSSGKTEIYIHLINQFRSEGKQTLYLLPEIALTTQLQKRLKAVYGNKLGIYHSRIEDNHRAEIWRKMKSNKPYEVIVGVRSSIFLPYNNLGLIIVDEEHETSYKQHEPAPRYHARDTAIMMSHIHEAKTLLGSATPSLESYYNAVRGKYGHVILKSRYMDILMPEIRIENTFELIKRKQMKTVLAPALRNQMQESLEDGEQVILFRNRRGFASLLECKQCAWTPKCTRCDVTLTYHKMRNRLVCHYCNSNYRMPTECPSCHSESLNTLGKGTEQLEEEIANIFPEYRVARMDMDTTRGKNSYEKIIESFQYKKIDILVGTQMLSKGLDFDNVGVVGIVSADSLLNYPDFRSHERGFQLMMQTAGRVGRKNKQGKVIIQSSDPSQPIYNYILKYDYEGFFHKQLAERKLFKYPPYTRLISINFKDKKESKVESAAQKYARLIKVQLGDMVLGPNRPIVSRIQQYYIREILLKLTNISPTKIREFLIHSEKKLREDFNFRSIYIYYNVDVS